jgi:hypothetical protein
MSLPQSQASGSQHNNHDNSQDHNNPNKYSRDPVKVSGRGPSERDVAKKVERIYSAGASGEDGQCPAGKITAEDVWLLEGWRCKAGVSGMRACVPGAPWEGDCWHFGAGFGVGLECCLLVEVGVAELRYGNWDGKM